MASGILTEKDLEDLNRRQIEEIEKYRWHLGEQLHHDPLLDISLNEICIQWINLYARKFRYKWCQEHGIVCNCSGECNGECDPS